MNPEESVRNSTATQWPRGTTTRRPVSTSPPPKPTCGSQGCKQRRMLPSPNATGERITRVPHSSLLLVVSGAPARGVNWPIRHLETSPACCSVAYTAGNSFDVIWFSAFVVWLLVKMVMITPEFW